MYDDPARTNIVTVQSPKLCRSVPELETPRISEQPNAIVILPDKFTNIVSIYERIESADQAFTLVDELCETKAQTDLELGGVFRRIKDEKWVGDYDNFDELCENRFGTKPRKARYLIRNNKWVVDSGLTEADVGSVGWTKLRLLPGKIKPSEAKTWIAKARQLTVLELTLEVASYSLASSKGQDGDSSSPSEAPQRPMSEKAMAVAAITDVTLVEQAEYHEEIAQHGGMIRWMQKSGPKFVLEVFFVAFPDLDLSDITDQESTRDCV